MTPDWSAAPAPIPYADLRNPQTLNLFQYAHNNPESLTDSDGHCGPLCAAVVGLAVGYVSVKVSGWLYLDRKTAADARAWSEDTKMVDEIASFPNAPGTLHVNTDALQKRRPIEKALYYMDLVKLGIMTESAAKAVIGAAQGLGGSGEPTGTGASATKMVGAGVSGGETTVRTENQLLGLQTPPPPPPPPENQNAQECPGSQGCTSPTGRPKKKHP